MKVITDILQNIESSTKSLQNHEQNMTINQKRYNTYRHSIIIEMHDTFIANNTESQLLLFQNLRI